MRDYRVRIAHQRTSYFTDNGVLRLVNRLAEFPGYGSRWLIEHHRQWLHQQLSHEANRIQWTVQDKLRGLCPSRKRSNYA